MLKRYSLSILLLLLVTSCTGPAVTELFPVRTGDRYGFMDRTGKMVIPPQYAQAGCFTDGLALTAAPGEKTLWGYVDKTGKYIVPASYTDASGFSEGIAFVVAENGEPVAIDNTGAVKFTLHEAEQVANFSEGLAAYSILTESGEQWGFIDKEGKTRIAPKFAATGFFSGPFCPVCDGAGKWGYINKEGAITIDYKFDNVSPFYGTVAKVYVNGKWGVIDNAGKYVLQPLYSNVDIDKDKFLVALNDKFGWVDKNGKMVIAARFADAFPFNGHKYAAVRSGDKWGYIDNTGNFTINPQFEFAFGYDGDLAPVRVNNKLGFIDMAGKTVIAAVADDISMDYYLRAFAKTSAFNGVTTLNNSPKFTGYKWLIKFYHLQFEAAKTLSTEDTKTLLDQFGGLTGMMPDSSKEVMMKIRVGVKDCKENGGNAILTYITSDNPDKQQMLYLVKKDDRWLVQFSKNDAVTGSADDAGADGDNNKGKR